jgi:hypothetical protein
MKHAGPAALATLEPLLARLRERLFADLRVGEEWLCSPVDTARQQRELLSRIDAGLRRRGRKR